MIKKSSINLFFALAAPLMGGTRTYFAQGPFSTSPTTPCNPAENVESAYSKEQP